MADNSVRPTFPLGEGWGTSSMGSRKVWMLGRLSLRGGRPSSVWDEERASALWGLLCFLPAAGNWGTICQVAVTLSGAPWDLIQF